MSNINDIRHLFESQLARISEDDAAGRGKSPMQLGKGLGDAMKSARTSLAVDYLNQPPPRAKFDAMNYYTLDVRLTPPIAVKVMQKNTAIYERAATEAIAKYITDSSAATGVTTEGVEKFNKIYDDLLLELGTPPQQPPQPEQTPSGTKKNLKGNNPNEVRVKCVIRDAFDASITKLNRAAQQGERAKRARESAKDLNQTQTQSNPQSTTLPNTTQVNSSVDMFAVLVGHTLILDAADNTQPPESSNINQWNPEWDVMPLDQLLQVPELDDIISQLPAFLVSGKPGTVCIVSVGGFVAAVSNALESAFRGSVKNGVTIEELLGGKFSRKLVNPEVGAFINKIQDQTSNKAIDFRSWNEDDLEILHNIIMHTFSDSDILKTVSTAKEEEESKKATGVPAAPTAPATPAAPTAPAAPVESVEKFDKKYDALLLELGTPPPAPTTPAPTAPATTAPKGTPKTLKGLVLYMTQADFNKFVKGGQGWKKAAQSLGADLTGSVKVLNI